MAHIQTQQEWEETMAQKVLEVTRSELYLNLRYLDGALSALPWQADGAVQTFATEGAALHFSTEQLLRLYRKNQKFVLRAYLHTVLHCLFRHLWTRRAREPKLWSLCCDIAVESVIDGLGRPALTRPLSLIRQKLYADCAAAEIVLAPAPLYRALFAAALPAEQLDTLRREFYVDDHRYWPADPQNDPAAQQLGKNWEKQAQRTETQMDARASEAGQGSQALKTQVEAGRTRRGYAEFLRKFAVLREEQHLDPDTFDLNFYTYGLRVYGNMPLVEPVESREVHKIREFVVVLDTSYSTSGRLVKAFLTETFAILKRTDSFFTRCNLRILQCDDGVREDVRITDTAQLDAYMARFTLVGGGGTDFRPAFAHVDKLLAQGAFTDLKGLLYFTDGKGTYPSRRPPYQTAFLFLGPHDADAVPPWAMRMTLEPEDFDSGGAADAADFSFDAQGRDDPDDEFAEDIQL